MLVTTAPAANRPQSDENWPTLDWMSTGSVYRDSSVMNVDAMMNSFHAVMNENSAVTAMPGRASGNMMRRKIIHVDAPSMRAASSSSRGSVSKWPLRVHTQNGIAVVE